MTRSEEIIWLAGLCEGEASFGAHHSKSRKDTNRRPCLSVKLEMTDRDIIEQASKIFPSNAKICKDCNKSKVNHRNTFVYKWNGNDAEKVMRAVLPYMGERRSAKIRECLKTPNLSHRKATA